MCLSLYEENGKEVEPGSRESPRRNGIGGWDLLRISLRFVLRARRTAFLDRSVALILEIWVTNAIGVYVDILYSVLARLIVALVDRQTNGRSI